MADFTELKAYIQSYIYQNSAGDISGQDLQGVLIEMVEKMGDDAINAVAAAIADEITARQNAVQAEADARAAAVQNEATARYNADRAEAQRAEAAFDNLELEDTAGAGVQPTQINLTLRKNDGTEADPDWRTLTQLILASATTSKAGLMSAADKSSLDYILDQFAFVGVASTSTNPGTPQEKVFYLTAEKGTFTNFLDGSSHALSFDTAGLRVLYYVPNSGWQYSNIILIEDKPNANSSSLVKSGGVDAAIRSMVGYLVCTTAGATAAKTITGSFYILQQGGSLKVKFNYKNTADDATLKIGDAEAQPLFYAGRRAGSSNSWEAGEVVEIFYDGTNYYANNVMGGGAGDGAFDISVYNAVNGTPTEYAGFNAAVINDNIPTQYRKGGVTVRFIDNTTSPSKYVQYRLMKKTWSRTRADWQGVDDNPTAGSENLPKSGGVYSWSFNYKGALPQGTSVKTDFSTEADKGIYSFSKTDVSDLPIDYTANTGFLIIFQTNLRLLIDTTGKVWCKSGDSAFRAFGVLNSLNVQTLDSNSETQGVSQKVVAEKIISLINKDEVLKALINEKIGELKALINEKIGELKALINEKIGEITETIIIGTDIPISPLPTTFGQGWVNNYTVGEHITFRDTTSETYGYCKIDLLTLQKPARIKVHNFSALVSTVNLTLVESVFTNSNDIVLSIATKVVSSGTVVDIANRMYAVPQDARYFYFNLRTSNSPSAEYNGMEVLPLGINGVIKTELVDNYNTISVTPEDYGVKRDGTYGSDSSYKHAEIAVLEGDNYRLSGASYWNYPFFVFKNSNNEIVSTYPAAYETQSVVPEDNIIFIAPSNGTLVVNLNLADTNVSNDSTIEKYVNTSRQNTLEQHIIGWDNLTYTLQQRINGGNSKLQGKTIYNDGDSVARGGGSGSNHQVSYAEQIATLASMILTHGAVSGTTIGYKDGSTSPTPIPTRMINNLTSNNYDYIVFQGGYNDIGHCSLGTISNGYDAELDPSTTIGGLETICKWLMANKPEAKKLFILGHRWAGNANQDRYWTAIVQVLKKWGIPYVNMYEESQLYGINTDFKNAWFYEGDGLHPNTDAYTTFYVDRVLSALESL